jgi:hypothetical protein
MNWYNLKKYVLDIHPWKPVRERIVRMLSFDKFVFKMSNSANNNVEVTDNLYDPQVNVPDEEEEPITSDIQTNEKESC